MTHDLSLTTRERKRCLRKEVLAKLAAMTASDRAMGSSRICDRIMRQPFWQKAATVLFFAPTASEPDIWELLQRAPQAGKQALLLRSTPEGGYEACRIADASQDVSVGRFGIREAAQHCSAVALNWLDLVLVPGVAFDLQGRRLGRGKGYYDRLLPAVRGVKCGVAFDEQLVREVPLEQHDILLNCILTPSRCIEL